MHSAGSVLISKKTEESHINSILLNLEFVRCLLLFEMMMWGGTEFVSNCWTGIERALVGYNEYNDYKKESGVGISII